MTLTLTRAGPSLFGAALTTIAAAAPLLFCRVLLFRQMGEFILACTILSLLVAMTLLVPLLHTDLGEWARIALRGLKQLSQWMLKFSSCRRGGAKRNVSLHVEFSAVAEMSKTGRPAVLNPE